MAGEGYGRTQLVGLAGGPLLFALVTLGPPLPGLSPAGTAVLASTCWIATWWITEAVPIPVTSLLPIVLFPTMGVADVGATTAPYADPVIFLFLGGFLLALAIERWNLHRRIALTVLLRIGNESRRLILRFMLVTAFLSMWVSNTATAMMMVPIGMAVVAQRQATPSTGSETAAGRDDDSGSARTDGGTTDDGSVTDGGTADDGSVTDQAAIITGDQAARLGAGTIEHSEFGVALMLAIAYSASIGGAATLIGTPPNAILAGIASSTLDVRIGFLEWMLFAVPVAAIFLVVAWVVLLSRLSPSDEIAPDQGDVVAEELRSLGSMGAGERRVLAVFGLVVVGWLTRPFLIEPVLPAITDTSIAIAGGVALFVVPVDLDRGEFLLEWEASKRIPWGVLILFGAGFSLAAAFRSSGLDRWVADGLTALQDIQFALVLLALATVIVFLTEVTSNSATSSLFIPVMASLAVTLAAPPLVLMVTVAVAASFAFMLPVATPPNTIVFGSGYVSIPEMARVGIWLNLVGILLLTLATYFWLPVVWGL